MPLFQRGFGSKCALVGASEDAGRDCVQYEGRPHSVLLARRLPPHPRPSLSLLPVLILSAFTNMEAECTLRVHGTLCARVCHRFSEREGERERERERLDF